MTTSRLNLLRPNDGGDTRLYEQIDGILNGQTRNGGTFTLAANTTNTIVNDPRFESGQFLCGFSPMSVNAAAALTNLYVSARASKQFTLTHSNTATTDRTFGYIFVG